MLLFIPIFLVGTVLIILLLPLKGTGSFRYQAPSKRMREGDSVLSRRLLKPDTAAYDSYYQQNPQFRKTDDRSRNSPGLLNAKAQYYDPGTFAAAKANFEVLEYMAAITHGHPSEKKLRMMQSAPQGTSVMESSEQYLRSGILALKLAAWIRELGFEATAHIDGNYEVICPLVAVDAGLGTIGRMGLLMTPDLGPRVRISVVTTNMPLPESKQKTDRTLLHFCHRCKKCARVCPVGAIPEGPQSTVDGVGRWKINSEKCFHFWTTSGTDCGRCISACPYSHPDNSFHRFIRWAIKNNLLFRRLAIKLDDIIYGPEPAVKRLPHWSDIIEKP